MADDKISTQILLIAPVGSGKSATNVIGGNAYTAAEIIQNLGIRGFQSDVIDTSGSVTNLARWKIQAIRLVRFLRMVRSVLQRIRYCRLVFLVIAPHSAIIVASSLWMICKIVGRPMVLRVTGSALSLVYRNYGTFARWLADRTYMRCSLVYVETRQLRRDFQNHTNFRWFPNTRNIKVPSVIRHEKIRKLIFIARLEMDKGLAETLDACRHLPERCHLRVFGPGTSNTDFSLLDDHPKASYGGVLELGDVPRVLSQHDLLLFPSYYREEGYAGVILEAFQCGLPVVAAKWGGVPELVEHEKSGLLVEPRSATALKSAIKRLLEDPDLYRQLCRGAKHRGEDFRSTNWYGEMALSLHGLCHKSTRF